MKRFAAIILLLLPAASQAVKPTTRPEPKTFAEGKAFELADQKKDLIGFPTIGPYTLKQVLRIRIDDHNRLVASSPLESYETKHLINLGHPDDLATIKFHSMSTSSAPDQPRFIDFSRSDFRDPNCIYRLTEVLAEPGRVQIAGSVEFLGESSCSVDLIDTEDRLNDAGGKDDAQISFHVQASDTDGNETHKIELTATDLRTLQRKYPAEVNEFVRPILRELDAESLLQVDPKLAWEIFAPDSHPAKELTETVNALLPKLDATDFAQREQSAESLKKLGPPAAVVLFQLDRNKLTPEQNSRIDDILTDYPQLKPEQLQHMAQDPSFLLNAMDSDELDLRRVALQHLTQILGHSIAFDPAAPPETRLEMLDKLRKQLTPPPATRAIEKSPQ
ncbi:MAG TPA: hypothetical protein VFE58_18705 [Tepidisphaeraceae bacterium]|nr:hypothetical protein [Tepidisphaeraceae bacterium]